MKLVTFAMKDGSRHAGVLAGDQVYSLADAGFSEMLEVVAADETSLAAAAELIEKADSIPLSGVTLLAPIARPPRIFCIGLNYASHAAESQMKTQAVPTVFMKLASSVTGPDTDVVLPYNSAQPDWEVELAVVIGKPGYRIRADDWKEHVFGYTIVNDVSARDVQLATSQWTLGKSFPTFTPMGPVIVTADEVADPHALAIGLTLDGEPVQKSNTRDLIFRIPALIEYISAMTPLEAGDIISTGTPEGVGLGMKPQRWLKDGEVMVCSVEGLGELRNTARAEAQAA